MTRPGLFGIVNITADSFSDGGKYLDPQAALCHAQVLLDEGADVLDIGPASSHPDAGDVSLAEEIARLQRVWPDLQTLNAPLSVDSFQPATQRWALANGVDWLNDINGFAEPFLYDELADATCRLVVMHAIQGKGIATREAPPEGDIWTHILRFFDTRLEAFEKAGIARDRLVLDPGMGFFLGNQPEASLTVLADIGRLKLAFDLPVLVSVSRKGFLRQLVDCPISEAGPVSLAAELQLVAQGADFIRTHTPKNLRQALRLDAALCTVKKQ